MAATYSMHEALGLSALKPPFAQDPCSFAKPKSLRSYSKDLNSLPSDLRYSEDQCSFAKPNTLRSYSKDLNSLPPYPRYSEGPSPGALTAAVLHYVTAEAKMVEENDPSLGSLSDLLLNQEPSLRSELDCHVREVLLTNLMASIADTAQGMNGHVHELQHHIANRLFFGGEVDGTEASASLLGASSSSSSSSSFFPSLAFASEATSVSSGAASLPIAPPPGLCAPVPGLSAPPPGLCAPPPGLSLPPACGAKGAGTGGGVHLDDAALDLLATSLTALFGPPSPTSADDPGAGARPAAAGGAGAGAGGGVCGGNLSPAEASPPPSAISPPSAFSRPSPVSVSPPSPAAPTAALAPQAPQAPLTPTKEFRRAPPPIMPKKTVPLAQDGRAVLSEGALLVLHGLPADWKEADARDAISAMGFVPGDDFEVLSGGARGRLSDPFVRFVHPAAARALLRCLSAGPPPKDPLSTSSVPRQRWPWPDGAFAEFPDGEVSWRRAIALHRQMARVR